MEMLVLLQLTKNLWKNKKLWNLGSIEKFKHTQVGLNSRLDTLQAVILLRKLKFLDANNKKNKIAKYYDNIINRKITKLRWHQKVVYHQYVILVKSRKKLEKILNKENIQYGFHYPKSINQIEVLKNRFKKQKFRNSEKLARNGISMPIDPNLKLIEIKKIVKILNSF